MKKASILLLFCVVLCVVQVLGQPIKTGALPTALGEPASTYITTGTQPVALPIIYTLFTDSVDGGCNPGTCRALPLMLLTFEGKRTDINNVLLNWKTTNEINNAGFDVERLLGDGRTTFEKIAFVKGKNGGDKENKYQLPDANAFMGTSYYRLKQIDNDGKFVYSNIIAIKNTAVESLTVYPNPAGSILNLNVTVATAAKAQVYFTDVQGKTVITLQSFFIKGYNQQQVQVNKLAAGTYFIRLTTGNNTVLVSNFVKK